MIMIYLLPLKLTRTIPNMASPALEIIEAGFAKSGSDFFFVENRANTPASGAGRASVWWPNAP